MSMLQAQVDELRSMAESVGLAMPQAATLMMGAADTIDQLDLALDSKRIAERRVTELLSESDKLREERDSYKALFGHATVTDCELRRVRAAWKEDREQNAKLRELARDAWKCIHTGASCSDCRLIAGGCTLQTAMLELGVEVDW